MSISDQVISDQATRWLGNYLKFDPRDPLQASRFLLEFSGCIYGN
jgi:hypothetical protein